MAHLSLNCPFCNRQNTGFHSLFEVADPDLSPGLGFQTVLRCNACQRIAIGLFERTPESNRISPNIFPHSVPHDPKKNGYDLVCVLPRPFSPSCPNHVPDNIRAFYLEAAECLSRRAHNAAAPLFRKVLEITVKRMDPECPAGTNLKNRIDRLPAETGVTPSMKSWAHEIRLIGNEAVHEDEPVQEKDAKDIQAFTELFLTYAFALPGMLKERRKATEGEGA